MADVNFDPAPLAIIDTTQHAIFDTTYFYTFVKDAASKIKQFGFDNAGFTFIEEYTQTAGVMTHTNVANSGSDPASTSVDSFLILEGNRYVYD